MHRIMVAGIGTEVGKTVVSAILTTLFDGDYWKPVQCGDEKDLDTTFMNKLFTGTKHRIYPSKYSLRAPLSPHHSARLENTSIQIDSLIPPSTSRTLIIEGVGGVLVPLTNSVLTMDVFANWDCKWVIVSKHYLGSINHTLMTIESLQKRPVSILGIIFNGEPNSDSENVILNYSQLPCLGRLLPELQIDQETLHKYAQQWRPCFTKVLS